MLGLKTKSGRLCVSRLPSCRSGSCSDKKRLHTLSPRQQHPQIPSTEHFTGQGGIPRGNRHISRRCYLQLSLTHKHTNHAALPASICLRPVLYYSNAARALLPLLITKPQLSGMIPDRRQRFLLMEQFIFSIPETPQEGSTPGGSTLCSRRHAMHLFIPNHNPKASQFARFRLLYYRGTFHTNRKAVQFIS